MKRSMTRIFLFLVVLIGSVAMLVRPAGASPLLAPTPLDLAAIPLTPEETEAIGLEGYGWSFGHLRNRYETTRDLAPYYGVDPEEFERKMVAEAGLTRHYSVRTARPMERGTPSTLASRSIFTDVFQFASAEGAVAGDRYMAEIGVPADAEMVKGSRTFGDASRIARFSTSEDGPGYDVRVDGMVLSIRTGTLSIVLSLWDPIHSGEEPEPPTVAELEAMASRLMIRVGAARAGDLPDLGTRMVRLGVGVEFAAYAADSIESVDQRLFRGDQDLAFVFTIDFGGGPLSGHLMVIRSGQDVFEVRAYSPDGSSLATVATIAEAQLDCLRGFRCVERLPLPEELRAAA